MFVGGEWRADVREDVGCGGGRGERRLSLGDVDLGPGDAPGKGQGGVAGRDRAGQPAWECAVCCVFRTRVLRVDADVGNGSFLGSPRPGGAGVGCRVSGVGCGVLRVWCLVSGDWSEARVGDWPRRQCQGGGNLENRGGWSWMGGGGGVSGARWIWRVEGGYRAMGRARGG